MSVTSTGAADGLALDDDASVLPSPPHAASARSATVAPHATVRHMEDPLWWNRVVTLDPPGNGGQRLSGTGSASRDSFSGLRTP